MDTLREQQHPIVNAAEVGEPPTASNQSPNRESSLQVISHKKIKQAQKTTAPADSNNNKAIPSKTTTKKRKFEELDVKQEEINSRKYDGEVRDAYDENEEYKAISSKRKRTVGVPKAMGTKVSQLVQGYENQAQQSRMIYQYADPSGKSKHVSAASDRDMILGRATADFVRVPSSLQQSTANTAVARVQSSLVKVNQQVASSSYYSKQTSRLNIIPKQPDVGFTGKARHWACHRCGTQMIPYIFNAHMNDQLKCSNARCLHTCCAKCAVGSAGEVCEPKEWHEHGMGYWGWVQSKRLTAIAEMNEDRGGGRGRGRYIRKK